MNILDEVRWGRRKKEIERESGRKVNRDRGNGEQDRIFLCTGANKYRYN